MRRRVVNARPNIGEGSDLMLIATGSSVHPTLAAAELLRAKGLSVGVLRSSPDVHYRFVIDTSAFS